MIVAGFQPLSLIDYPGKIASIVFTQGCLFRCPFCHNPKLIAKKNESSEEEQSAEKEFWEHLERRKGFIDGVVVTGGEPTLHADLPEFLARIKSMGYLVKLDTNGIMPEMVREILSRKLVDYFAMDLKDVWGRYQRIANIAPGKEAMLKNCEETFGLIRNSGIPYEWRTTVLPGVHTEESFVGIAEQLLPGEKYFLQDINYAVTLRKLDNTKRLDVPAIAERLQRKFPELVVDVR
jgi:pyruvate formate lyase activating enzyme